MHVYGWIGHRELLQENKQQLAAWGSRLESRSGSRVRVRVRVRDATRVGDGVKDRVALNVRDGARAELRVRVTCEPLMTKGILVTSSPSHISIVVYYQ